MAAANSTDYDSVIRELWPTQRIAELLYSRARFLALCNRQRDFAEKIKHIAVAYQRSAGRSATFADAQAASGSVLYEDFQLTLTSSYGWGSIDGLLLERSQHRHAVLVEAIEVETRNMLEEIALNLSKDTWGQGSGELGVVAGAPAGDVITVGVGEAKRFETGYQIVAAATSTGGLNAGGASTTIIEINLENGTIEVEPGGVAAVSIIDGDFLFQRGDAADGGAIRKISGVRAWIPLVGDPISAPFFGVDRTIYPERFAGHRFDGSGLGSKEEAIKRMVAIIRDQGPRRNHPNIVWMNPIDMDDLDSELGTVRRRYERIDVPNADIGFDALTFRGPGGMLRVLDDPWVPPGQAWCLAMDTWFWGTLGEAPRIIMHDGNRVLRIADDDAIEFRGVARGQVWCDEPFANGVVTLPS